MIAFECKLLMLVAIGTCFFDRLTRDINNSYQVQTGNQYKMLIFIALL